MPDSPAARVRALRARLGLTQAEFGTLFPTNNVTVCRWETGSHRPSPMALRRLAELEAMLPPLSPAVAPDDPEPSP